MPQSSRLERTRMEDLLTVEQAAAKLQIAPKTLKDWLQAGRIKGVRLGKLWRIKECDLAAFVDQGANESRADITAAEEALANPIRIPYEQTRQKFDLVAYLVELTEAAEQDLSALPRDILSRVDARILTLADRPRPRGSELLPGGPRPQAAKESARIG